MYCIMALWQLVVNDHLQYCIALAVFLLGCGDGVFLSRIGVLGVLLTLKKPSSEVINVLFILYCSRALPQLALHVLFSARSLL